MTTRSYVTNPPKKRYRTHNKAASRVLRGVVVPGGGWAVRGNRKVRVVETGEIIANARGTKITDAMRAAIKQRREADRHVVVSFVEHRFDSREQAERWYETVPVPGLGKKTAAQLVAENRGDWVIHAINAIEAGVHA